MNEIKDIAQQELLIKDGQTVITTAQLAEVYGTTAKNITNNFQRNKDRFTEGKHYFVLQGEELREFKNKTSERGVPLSSSNSMYLWTRRGASRHCKILGTDKAWEQFDYLEENYFDRDKNPLDVSELSPELQMFKQLWDMQARQELEQKRIVAEQKQQAEQLNRIEQKQKTIIETFVSTADGENFRDWANKCISKIAESPKFDKGVGPNSNYAFARNESYERLKKKWKCNLEDRVSRAKGRALQRNPGISKKELDSINRLTIISADKSLRPVYETVIKEMMIAYCVDTDIKNR